VEGAPRGGGGCQPSAAAGGAAAHDKRRIADGGKGEGGGDGGRGGCGRTRPRRGGRAPPLGRPRKPTSRPSGRAPPGVLPLCTECAPPSLPRSPLPRTRRPPRCHRGLRGAACSGRWGAAHARASPCRPLQWHGRRSAQTEGPPPRAPPPPPSIARPYEGGCASPADARAKWGMEWVGAGDGTDRRGCCTTAKGRESRGGLSATGAAPQSASGTRPRRRPATRVDARPAIGGLGDMRVPIIWPCGGGGATAGQGAPSTCRPPMRPPG